MTLTVIGALQGARQRIAQPEDWTQGALARTSGGRAVRPLAHNAVRVCLYGALIQVIQPRDGASEILLGDCASALYAVTGLHAVGDFNDTHTHAEVLAGLDATIEHLLEERIREPLPIESADV
jgi:hypothetical protein